MPRRRVRAASALAAVTATAVVAIVACLSAPALALDNGVGRVPPLGWSTWMTCGDAGCDHDICTEDEIKAVAQAMKDNGMQALGYEYLNMDDCWVAQDRNTTSGELMWDTTRFPNGIPALADHLHSMGYKFGVYTSAGNETCTGKVGSAGHYAQDAQTFADWQFDYIKLDWCGDIKYNLSDGANAHREFAKAVNDTGRPIFIEVVTGYFFLWGETDRVANAWRFCEDHHDAWKSTSEQLLCRLDQGKSVGSPGGWPHMDFLMTGGAGCHPFSAGAHCPGQTDDEYTTSFVIWLMTQSPLIVATDVRNMTSIMNQALLNKELIDIHQSTLTPPGKQLGTWPCSELLACQIWGRELSGDGSQWMVALTNTGSKDHKITVNWSDLSWSSTATAHVHDLWNSTDLADATGSWEADVPSHGTRVVKLTQA